MLSRLDASSSSDESWKSAGAVQEPSELLVAMANAAATAIVAATATAAAAAAAAAIAIAA